MKRHDQSSTSPRSAGRGNRRGAADGPVAPVLSDPAWAEAEAPSEQWALSLLAQAIPYQEEPGRRQRVWRALEATRVRPTLRWSLAFVLVGLVASAAFAGAATAGWPSWLARAIGRTPSTSAVQARAKPGQPPPGRVFEPVALPEAQPVLSPPAPQPEEPPASPTASPSSHGHRVAKSAALKSPRGRDQGHDQGHGEDRVQAHGEAQGQAHLEDSGPLLAAMRALRVEHDPVHARRLLSEYLAEHPRGLLAEEALVMLVEAAVAHHDGDAAALVARYNRLYPNGTFRSRVDRLTAGPASGPAR